MTERGIIFSGPMVRAILAGKKTQTRRVVKPQPPHSCCYAMNGNGDKALCMAVLGTEVPTHPWFVPPRATSADTFLRCPHGVAGDRLWVRETWGLPPAYDPARHGDLKSPPSIGPVCYGAEYLGISDNKPRPAWEGGRWRPSIHMPKWASRITLEVTGVRVERIQDISEADAQAEISRPLNKTHLNTDGSRSVHPDCIWRDGFQGVWDSINAKRGYGWDVNPWVWVIEFKPIERRTR